MALVNQHVSVCYLAGADKRKKREKAKGLDRIKEYVLDVMSFGLLLMEFNEAISEEDGNHICDHLHKRDHMPYFVKMSYIQYQIAQLMLISMEYLALV